MNKLAINTFSNLLKKSIYKDWSILIGKLKLIKFYIMENPVFFSDFIKKNTELLEWYYIEEKLLNYEVDFLKILDPVLKSSCLNWERIIDGNISLLHNEWLFKTNNKNIKYFEILDMYTKLWHEIDLTYTIADKLIINIKSLLWDSNSPPCAYKAHALTRWAKKANIWFSDFYFVKEFK